MPCHLLKLIFENRNLPIVSSERSSLISSVLAIGAMPSGMVVLSIFLLPLETFEFLVFTNGEWVGEQSGVDFLSRKK